MKKLVQKDGYMIVYEMINGWNLKLKEVERIPIGEWYKLHPESRPDYKPPVKEPATERLSAKATNPDAANTESADVTPKGLKKVLREKETIIPKHSAEKLSSNPAPTSAKLCVVMQESIEQSELQLINQGIDQLIAVHSHNRQEINRLVFESVAAMTAGEDYERQLANKKGLRRFFGGITGSNKKLQDKINSNRTMAQYAAQQTLQRLAEQNLMTFDLIAAVNNKLNASVVAVESEINQIYSALITFFKQSRSDMIQLESRVDRLEKNVNLLNWQNAIEYQMFDGVEYADLNDTAKIVCLVRDFYNITKGEWTTSDLLLLKTAMSTIDLSPKKSIDYFGFIKEVAYDSCLSQYLLDGKEIAQQPELYMVPLLGMRKLSLLDGEERFVVDALVESLSENGVAADRQGLIERTAKKYLMQEAQVNPDTQVNCYDLIMEMLFNLQVAESTGALNALENSNLDNVVEEPLEVTFQRAAALYKNCELKEAYPLLVELSNKGYARANALLYWLLTDGCEGHPSNAAEAAQYAKKGYQAGDPICALQYALFSKVSQEEKIKICKEYKPRLEELDESGDVFATYMMGICYINVTDEEEDCFKALNYFISASRQNFYRSVLGVALRYYYGEGVEKNLESAFLWAEQAMEFPQYASAWNYAGDIAIDEGKELGEDMDEVYQYVHDLYSYAAGLGNATAYKNMGVLYEAGWGVEQDYCEAAEYYKLAAELGQAGGQYYLARLHMNGTGVPQDRQIAKEWLEKSAAQGYQWAIDLLKQEFDH